MIKLALILCGLPAFTVTGLLSGAFFGDLILDQFTMGELQSLGYLLLACSAGAVFGILSFIRVSRFLRHEVSWSD